MNRSSPRQQSPSPAFPGLTSRDVCFLRKAFGEDLISLEEMTILLEDRELRDHLIGSTFVFDALEAESPDGLGISEYLYYSVQVRSALMAAGVGDLECSEQVARALMEIAERRREHEEARERAVKYVPIELRIVRIDANGGERIRISGELSPYQLWLEAFRPHASVAGDNSRN